MHVPAKLEAASCPAYILAGGQSSRFGSDKALELIDGQPQLLRLQAMLQQLGHSVAVVADDGQRYRPLGISSLVDTHPHCGPMAGLARALLHRLETFGPGWLLLISSDQALWTSGWFDHLAAGSQNPMVVVFAEGRLLQPIPGIYHTRFLAELQPALESRRLSLRRLLEATAAATISASPNPRTWSFNTPDELARIREQLPRS